MNTYEYMQSIPLFSEMTNDELKTLAQSMILKDFPDKHVFISEDRSSDTLYIILEGEIEITHEKDTERGLQSVSTLGPGGLIGLHSLIQHYKPIVTCQARGKVKAASLPSSAFNLLYQYNTHLPHHFQINVAKQLAADYRNIVKELKEMMLSDSDAE